MRIAHTADLHLGRRQFDRHTKGGLNQREADGYLAWRNAVESIIQQAPDLILIAGDCFDTPRPTPSAIIDFYSELARIRSALPNVPVTVVSGNHDESRTTETAAILALYRTLGVHVVLDRIERIAVPGALITAVPHRCAGEEWAPDPSAECNVLLLHAGVTGVSPGDAGITAERFAGWDYVALGDYHVQHQIATNAWYPGSLEFTSSDPWSEARSGVPKGFLVVDLPGPVVTPMPMPTRRFLDLPGFDATGMAAAELDLQIAQRVDEAAIDDAVVRLVVTGVTRDLRAALDHAAIRSYKGRALHFQLELRRADVAASVAVRLGEFRKLDDIVGAFLGERTLPPDVDRNEFVRQGMAMFTEDPYSGLPVGEREVA